MTGTTMRACRFYGPGRIGMEEVPIPQVGPGEILMQVEATALCASDIRVYRGEKAARSGVILGHEVAGTVAALGEGSVEFALGDRITIYPVIACGECFFCVQGKRNRCLRRTTLGYEVDGGLAEYLLIPSSLVRMGHVLRVPSHLPLELASLTEPLACVLNSLETCGVGPGCSLLILGAGPMGLMHVIAARAMGAAQILVSEPQEERRNLAQELGASIVLKPDWSSLKEVALTVTGSLGVDAAIVTVGLPEVVEECLTLVRRQGWVNLFAGCAPGVQLQLDPNLIHYNELRVTGTQNATLDQFRRSLAWLVTLEHPLASLISHRLPLGRAPEAFQARMALEGLKPLILPALS